jgi:hypothetical protein
LTGLGFFAKVISVGKTGKEVEYMQKTSAVEMLAIYFTIYPFLKELEDKLESGEIKDIAKSVSGSLVRSEMIANGRDNPKFEIILLESIRDAVGRALEALPQLPKKKAAALVLEEGSSEKEPFDFWKALDSIQGEAVERQAVRVVAAAMLAGHLWKILEDVGVGSRLNFYALHRDGIDAAHRSAQIDLQLIETKGIKMASACFRTAAPLFNDGEATDEGLCRTVSQAAAIVSAYRRKAIAIIGDDRKYWTAEAVRKHKRTIADTRLDLRSKGRLVLENILRLLNEAAIQDDELKSA